ncbi:MAG TPA: choice-of-anchor U domain-containing protein, partial [Gammaproteobacteria bacterium]
DIEVSVDSVIYPVDATYLAGQHLNFMVSYQEAMSVSGTPRLELTVGTDTRYADYVSGTNPLLFRYVAQAGDNDSDGVVLNSEIDLNGGAILDNAGNDGDLTVGAAGLTAVLVDTQAPSVTSVTLPANGAYIAGQNLDFTVNYDEAVIANGSMPRLALTIGSTLRHADYISGSGTNVLLFRHTVLAGDIDSDGISLNPALDLNGGTLRDAGGNNAGISLGAIGSLAAVLVDAQAPSITSVTLPADNIYLSGENLDFTVNYDEAVTVNTAGGTPRLALTVGSTTRFATYTAGSGTNALLFRYTAQNGDNDNDGIALNTTLDVNGGSVRDGAGNDAGTGLGTIGSLAGVLVDTQAPSVDSVTLPADDSYREGQNLDFTVNFDETLTVNTAGGTPRLELTVGATTRYADYVGGSGSAALLFRYTVQAGDNDGDGIALNATLQPNGGTLRDVASNDAATDLGTLGSLAGVLVDTQTPSIVSVSLPANAIYTTDQDLDFTVNYDENITVDTAGGAPRLALTIGAATQYAGYVSGSGTSALLFRYTVQDGDSDGDGIELNATLDANGGTLRDTAGNDAGTDLGANDLSGVLVDALDTDGDGVSDVQEGIDGTDPNDPDDYLDDTAPVVTAPADLVIDATGLYTPVTLRQLLGLAPAATDEEVQQAQAALATDNIDGADCCNTQAQGLENDRILLQPGQTQIVWQGSDRKGNNGQAAQNVNVRPLVSVGKDQTGVEGGSVDFRVILNGLSPFYPLEVPFVIDTTQSSTDNTDHDLIDGTVIFNAGETVALVTINLADDMLPEGDETLVVRLDDLTDNSEDLAGGYNPSDINDINSGAVTQQTITITESNVAPDVALNMQQNAVNVALVANNGGDVTVTANVTDPNAGETHSYDWSGTDSQLTDTDGDVTDATFVFDPALLSAGVHTVQVSVTDSGSATVTRLLHFSVVAEAPVLDPLDDTDGDGVDDVTEGIADSDSDGIPDYRDNIAAGNVLPETTDVTDAYLVECEPGVRCRLGSNALPGDGVRISAEDLPADSLYTNIGGLFDFEIHDLPVTGQSTRVVIPQIAAIPADAAYRKFADDQWFTFAEDASNALHSAQGEAGFCPPPGDASWEPGLVEGYLCVQLTLEDGGANDTDGQANGSIADPGGVGQPVAVTPPSSSWTISGSTRGGGGALGLPAGLALLLLVLMRNGRRAATLCGLLAALLASAAQAQESETPAAEEAAVESMEDTGETSSRWQRLLDSFAEKGYLTLGLYQAEGDQSRGDFVGGMANDGVTLTVQGYDVSRTAYQLSLGYRYRPGMAVEFGYLDLGDVDFAFTATAANAAVLSEALSQNLPISSDGWLLSHRFDYMFGDWRASGDVGLYFWDGKASINDPTINTGIKDGTDPLIGLQVAYPLADGLELAVQYRRILFDDQSVSLWGGALSWSF